MKKINKKSLKIDGKSDYIKVSDSNNWYFGKKDFTIEFGITFENKKQAQKFWKLLNKFLKEKNNGQT